MISRKARTGVATFLLLACFGCASTQGEAAGGRNWLGYLRYGSEDTPEEAAANGKAYRECWGMSAGEPTTNPAPDEPIGTPAKVTSPPRNAFTDFIDNRFSGPWSASFIPLGPDRLAFDKGDKVKVKVSSDGPTMTIEYVPLCWSVDARYYSESLKESCQRTMRYRCRWKNVDGSESTGEFREEELEPVSVGG